MNQDAKRIDTGGPAFPRPLSAIGGHDAGGVSPEFDGPIEGMTLRDYFAAKAMQTLVHDWCEGDPKHADGVAVSAYEFADAMIAARSVQS